MGISHPIPSVNELGFEVERRSLVKTRHFRMSMSDRPNLGEGTVVGFVKEGWDDALYMHYLGSDGVSERYNVIFDKSNK